MLLDCDTLKPPLLFATLQALCPLEVERSGETFTATEVLAVSEEDITFRVGTDSITCARHDIIQMRTLLP